MVSKLEYFLQTSARKGKKIVPARIQAALALLERLRTLPSSEISSHQKSGSSGVIGHETYGDRALKRLGLQPLNKNHGRRSSNLSEWGQGLLDAVVDGEFTSAEAEERNKLITIYQEFLASPLRSILEQEPLNVRIKGRTAEAVIHDILLQAEQKGKSGEVGQYLVGAKLALRFNREIPVAASNKSDRKSHGDKDSKPGDFVIENTVIEVAAGLPDDKHLEQVVDILENSDSEVWLLARADRVAGWQNEILRLQGLNSKRVVVTSIESFVGQNVTELAEFSSKGKAKQLAALFELYNSKWVSKVGTPGIRIVLIA